MTERDVLIARLFAEVRGASLPAGADEGPWRVTARGQSPRTFGGFREAYDVALVWANQTGGDVYRLSVDGADPELYTPTG
jgi:hypothetical protein